MFNCLFYILSFFYNDTIKELGNDNFLIRENASKTLSKASWFAYPSTLLALKNEDAEIRMRSEICIRKLYENKSYNDIRFVGLVLVPWVDFQSTRNNKDRFKDFRIDYILESRVKETSIYLGFYWHEYSSKGEGLVERLRQFQLQFTKWNSAEEFYFKPYGSLLGGPALFHYLKHQDFYPFWREMK